MPWKKGQSGNPGGRPKVATEIRELAKRDAASAYEAVREIMADPDSKQRLAAALAILKVAGVPMTESKADEAPGAQPTIGKGASTEELMKAAVAGEG